MSYKKITNNVGDLFSVLIKITDRLDNDEIRISRSRAREILNEIRSLNKEEAKSYAKKPLREPRWLSNPE
jgi:chromosomal replication initiation ATPase DnaA